MSVGKEIIVTREWAMPSIWTFDIPPIAALLSEEMNGGIWVDPFAGRRSPATITNDIETDRPTKHHLDALDFLPGLGSDSADGVLFDPPYSTEQCLRRYTPRQGGTAGRAEYWARCKDEIAREIAFPPGRCVGILQGSAKVGALNSSESGLSVMALVTTTR